MTQRLQNGLLEGIRRMSTRLAKILYRLLWCKYLYSTYYLCFSHRKRKS
jgi:hypothetical protein